MVEAVEYLAVALGLTADLGAPVGAGIDEHADPAVVAAAEDQWPAGQRARLEVARFRNLRLVPEEKPAAVVDVPLLTLEELVGSVGEAVDAEDSRFGVIHHQWLVAGP